MITQITENNELEQVAGGRSSSFAQLIEQLRQQQEARAQMLRGPAVVTFSSNIRGRGRVNGSAQTSRGTVRFSSSR